MKISWHLITVAALNKELGRNQIQILDQFKLNIFLINIIIRRTEAGSYMTNSSVAQIQDKRQ